VHRYLTLICCIALTHSMGCWELAVHPSHLCDARHPLRPTAAMQILQATTLSLSRKWLSDHVADWRMIRH
jgi:hypothetical protein